MASLKSIYLGLFAFYLLTLLSSLIVSAIEYLNHTFLHNNADFWILRYILAVSVLLKVKNQAILMLRTAEAELMLTQRKRFKYPSTTEVAFMGIAVLFLLLSFLPIEMTYRYSLLFASLILLFLFYPRLEDVPAEVAPHGEIRSVP